MLSSFPAQYLPTFCVLSLILVSTTTPHQGRLGVWKRVCTKTNDQTLTRYSKIRNPRGDWDWVIFEASLMNIEDKRLQATCMRQRTRRICMWCDSLPFLISRECSYRLRASLPSDSETQSQSPLGYLMHERLLPSLPRPRRKTGWPDSSLLHASRDWCEDCSVRVFVAEQALGVQFLTHVFEFLELGVSLC